MKEDMVERLFADLRRFHKNAKIIFRLALADKLIKALGTQSASTSSGLRSGSINRSSLNAGSAIYLAHPSKRLAQRISRSC